MFPYHFRKLKSIGRSLMIKSLQIIRNIFFCFVLLQPTQSSASDITTPEIVASGLSIDCLDYTVVGVCFWLHCGWSGCSVRTSVLIKHYIPELVVSSYQNTGENPWSLMAMFSPQTSFAKSGGNSTNSDDRTQSNLVFKNTDAIGHPGTVAFDALASGFGYSCSGGSTPFRPYFLSTLDTVAWRQGIPEMVYPQALIPGVRELKRTGDLWGNIYPRSGFANQVHDYKAAALMAQRTADLVTRRGQPHVYSSLSPSRRAGYWPPPPVMEGDEDTHKWQMLRPSMSSSCRVWPDRGITDPYGSRISREGNYVWSLWRPYECCKRRGFHFIARVPS
jgi:integrating conjugative element protein (TIGR03756 family)